MSSRFKTFVLLTFVLAVAGGLPAAAHARVAYSASKPKLSAAPVMGVPFTASGVIAPRRTTGSRTVVEVKLYMLTDGHYSVMHTYRAKLSKNAAGKLGTLYSRVITVPMEGKHAVRAFHYRGGKLVATSKLTSFIIAQRIDIDANVNGWIAPALGDTMAPAGEPLDIVFSTPADWAAPWPSSDKPPNGAAHFIWGDFVKVSADGLVWHTSGLRPGRYDWMRDAMPKWGTGSLVVTQQITIDQNSHADTHALPYLPADVDFGAVAAEGMGCNRSIAFLTRVFARTSADPLIWHTTGLGSGRYDWKCWMDDCHYGTLVVDSPQQVTVDSDPLDSVTVAPADTPLDVVFTGARTGAMSLCWRTIHFTTAGDFTKTSGYPDPVTWRTGGLAPGTYEWQCWMGPQCHHGTLKVE
jgi:hypothetical protein